MMEDRISFTASEIDYNISKYFNSFGVLKAKNANTQNVETITDSNFKIITVIGGEYICDDSHSSSDIENFIASVLHLD